MPHRLDFETHTLIGEDFIRDDGGYPATYSTNFEKTWQLAVKRTQDIIEQAQKTVSYYNRQLQALKTITK